MQTIRVKHNFEAAHRLYLTPGKCQRVHGHSWWCTLSLTGEVDAQGMLVEFGELKKVFRGFLDGRLDHSLLLFDQDDLITGWADPNLYIPGTVPLSFDPTTENLAEFIGKEMEKKIPDNVKRISIELWETQVNCATWWTERSSGYMQLGV